MRPAIKLFLIALVGLFFFVSCGPVTPIPSATPTMTFTATATRRPAATATPIPTEVRPTPQPTVSTRLLEQLPPSQPVDKYELVPWSSELPRKVMGVFNDNGYDLWPSDYEELGLKYLAKLGNETWLYAQSDDAKKMAMCIVVFEDPGSDQFHDLRPGQDLFSFLVEDLLNHQNVAVEKLPDKFVDEYLDAGCLNGFFLDHSGNIHFEPIFVYNLFGDGQDAYVFAVGTAFVNNRVAFYATHAVDGYIQVERIRDWEEYTSIASSTDIELVDVGDINGNGYNELVIEVQYGGSGYPGSSAVWLRWYEWAANVETFVGGEIIDVFGHGDNIGPEFGKWSLAKASNLGAVSVTAHEFLSTHLDECEFLTVEKKYLVSRTGTTLISEELLFPNNGILACEISWAYEIAIQPEGWKNDRAIQILSKAMDHWPSEMNSAWEGAAAQDYFRLMLGIWRDFRGEKDLAAKTLEPLLLSQTKIPGFISRLTEVYSNTRQTNGVIAACLAMNSRQRELLNEKYGDTIARLMGFRNPRWWTWVDEFCDEKAAILSATDWADVETAEITSDKKLQDWLTKQGKTYVFIREQVVGKRKVWLASFLAWNISQYDIDIYQLWAFSKTPQGLSAEFLDEIRLDRTRENVAERYNENSISTQLFAPAPGVQVVLVGFDDCLSFIKISPAGDLSVLGGECGTDLFYYSHDNQVDVLRNRYVYPREWEVTIYRWNPTNQTMEIDESGSFDFSAAQREAEKLIYREQDYLGAIVYINKFLLEAPPEQVFSPLCYDNIARNYADIENDPRVSLCDLPPEWYRPYLRYLLGVAYEMAGQPELAKLTFYALWNEYPTNLFGIAASQRLAPTQP